MTEEELEKEATEAIAARKKFPQFEQEWFGDRHNDEAGQRNMLRFRLGVELSIAKYRAAMDGPDFLNSYFA